MNTEPLYRYRHVAHIVIEAKTPLVFGSGEKDILADNMIAKDANGLPYIPGSTLAGTLRHALGEVASDNLFGFNGDSSDDGLGSSCGLPRASGGVSLLLQRPFSLRPSSPRKRGCFLDDAI